MVRPTVAAAAARRIVLFITQMRGQLGFQGALDQGLGPLLQQPVFAHAICRLWVIR
jgi:hypothetical protein